MSRQTYKDDALGILGIDMLDHQAYQSTEDALRLKFIKHQKKREGQLHLLLPITAFKSYQEAFFSLLKELKITYTLISPIGISLFLEELQGDQVKDMQRYISSAIDVHEVPLFPGVRADLYFTSEQDRAFQQFSVQRYINEHSLEIVAIWNQKDVCKLGSVYEAIQMSKREFQKEVELVNYVS